MKQLVYIISVLFVLALTTQLVSAATSTRSHDPYPRYRVTIEVTGGDSELILSAKSPGGEVFETDASTGALTGMCVSGGRIVLILECPATAKRRNCTLNAAGQSRTGGDGVSLALRCPSLHLDLDHDRVSDVEPGGSPGRPEWTVPVDVTQNGNPVFRFSFVDESGNSVSAENEVEFIPSSDLRLMTDGEDQLVQGPPGARVNFHPAAENATASSNCQYRLPPSPAKPIQGRCTKISPRKDGRVVRLSAKQTKRSAYVFKLRSSEPSAKSNRIRVRDEFGRSSSLRLFSARSKNQPDRRFLEVTVDGEEAEAELRSGILTVSAALGSSIEITPVQPSQEIRGKPVFGDRCVLLVERSGYDRSGCKTTPTKVGRPVFVSGAQGILQLHGITQFAIAAGPEQSKSGPRWSRFYLKLTRAADDLSVLAAYYEQGDVPPKRKGFGRPEEGRGRPLRSPNSGYLPSQGVPAGKWQVEVLDGVGTVQSLAGPRDGWLDVRCTSPDGGGCESESLALGKVKSIRMRVPVMFRGGAAERCWEEYYFLKLTNDSGAPFRACPGGAASCAPGTDFDELRVQFRAKLGQFDFVDFEVPFRRAKDPKLDSRTGYTWIFDNHGCDYEGRFLCGGFRVPSGAKSVKIKRGQLDFNVRRINERQDRYQGDACELDNDFSPRPARPKASPPISPTAPAEQTTEEYTE